MGYEVRACVEVAYRGIRQRVSVPFRDVFTYKSQFVGKTCATGDSELEATQNLHKEIDDYCRSTFIKCKSHEMLGKITHTKVESWSLWDLFVRGLGPTAIR